MYRLILMCLVGLAVSSGTLSAAPGSEDRLMIVDGNKRRVIYDDGRDDLYCVTRRRVVRYDQYGRPVYRRNMRCR